MKMRLSERIGRLQPQLARILYTKARQYRDVIDLTLGDPDMATPEAVKRAGCEAILGNDTHYTLNKGIAELRRAVADDIFSHMAIAYDPETEIIITPGAMGALYLASICLVDDGDEAILLAPHWPNYTNMILMCDGRPIDVNCYDVETEEIMRRLESTCNAKTRLLVINSPCNPTGQRLSGETLDAIAAFAVERDLIVISDEVYASIIFDGTRHDSILSRPGMRERTVLIDSLSKRFSMTGWRVGFAAAPENLIDRMTQMQEHTSACVSPFVQRAAVCALEHANEDAREIARTFESRCRFMAERLNRIDGISCRQPVATFYLFADIRKTGMSSEAFAYELLQQEQVAVVPGNAFGEYGEGFIRIACSVGEETLGRAADKIERFVRDRANE